MTSDTSSEARSSDGNELTLTLLAAIILRGRKTVVAVTFLAALSGAIWSQTRALRWESSLSFLPQGGTGGLPQLGGFAAQFGIQIPTGDQSSSPDFYVELIRSRDVLAEAVSTEFSVSDDDGERVGDLVTLLDFDGDTREERIEWATEWLRREGLTTSIGRQSGTVGLSVVTRWPEVSFGISSTILAAIEEFDLTRRQTKAKAEREFLDGRVADANRQLLEAEQALQQFLQQNRQFAEAPELALRHDRLQRRVAMRQQLATSLAEASETARINEVRNTPVINLVQAPIMPVVREPRGRIRRTVLATVLGFILGVAVVVMRSGRGLESGDGDQLRRAWQETVTGLRHPFGTRH